MPPRKRRRSRKFPDPPILQRVVFARYAFGWLAVETSVLGWRFSFGSAGQVTDQTDWQREPGTNLNQHVSAIIRKYEAQYGVERRS